MLSNSPATHVNVQDPRLQSPLHLACSSGRSDVVAILLAQPGIDDSLKDAEGRTCLECCKSPEVGRMVQVSRAQINDNFLRLLHAYLSSPAAAVVSSTTASTPAPPTSVAAAASSSSVTLGVSDEQAADQMYRFLERPRSRVVDLGVREDSTGTTMLHEAARRKDLHLIKMAISRGADVLARDKKNKMPIDVAKDEKVKAVLRAGESPSFAAAVSSWLTKHRAAATTEGRARRAQAHARTAPEPIPSGGSTTSLPAQTPAPVMKGFLSKWTNMARGYHTRWIVLENGTVFLPSGDQRLTGGPQGT